MDLYYESLHDCMEYLIFPCKSYGKPSEKKNTDLLLEKDEKHDKFIFENSLSPVNINGCSTYKLRCILP